MGEKVIVNIKTFMDGHGRPTACCHRCYDAVTVTGRTGHLLIKLADARRDQVPDARAGASCPARCRNRR